MENSKTPLLAVSDFILLANQTLDYAFSSVAIEGEVSGFKVNQNKYVFFDLKDESGSIGCFMTVWQLRVAIEDGMKVVVTATPKLTDWGKFSLTVQSIRPSGEGNLKKSFDLLKEKLAGEGLFNPERKRTLPDRPRSIAVISSTQAAGYADFIKIVNDRWGGMDIAVAHVQVQGREAPDQIIRALQHFNMQKVPPEVVVLVRGGGSLDDLSVFNDELLVREIAKSRIPTVTGIGHETDTTLADLAADVRAATPSNAAQLIVPDKREVMQGLHRHMEMVGTQLLREIDRRKGELAGRMEEVPRSIKGRHDQYLRQLEYKRQILAELDPKKVLRRGYALVRGVLEAGSVIEIETKNNIAKAEVTHVKTKA